MSNQTNFVLVLDTNKQPLAPCKPGVARSLLKVGKAVDTLQPLLIKSCGWGSRQMCRTDKYGFPIRHLSRQKVHLGFQTGDLIKADVPKGKYAGQYVGRVTVRPRGSFALKSKVHNKQIDVNYKSCQTVHKLDGYSYDFGQFVEVKQVVNIVKVKQKKVEQITNPVQLSLFDTTELNIESTKTKYKSRKKSKGDDYEQLSLF